MNFIERNEALISQAERLSQMHSQFLVNREVSFYQVDELIKKAVELVKQIRAEPPAGVDSTDIPF